MKNFLILIVFITWIIISCTHKNDLPETDLPLMDLHVHLNYAAQSAEMNASLAYEKASGLSGAMGVVFGIAEEFGGDDIQVNDDLLMDRIQLARKNGLYLGLQVSRRDWTQIFSRESLQQVDYILGDAMIFPGKEGEMLRIWVPGMPLGEPEEFMECYVAHNLQVLSEPITIWANPTFLPDVFASRYDELWTDARMKKLIDAAVKNSVAIEINSRYKIPSEKFIKMARAAGARFSFGTNQHGKGIGEIGWSVHMAEKCGLTPEDMYTPARQIVLN